MSWFQREMTLIQTKPQNTHTLSYTTSDTSFYIQWNLSNPDTLGTEESVLISEVSWFQGLNCTQTWHLGQLKVSCLLRCPYFRMSWLEGFHCRTYARRHVLTQASMHNSYPTFPIGSRSRGSMCENQPNTMNTPQTITVITRATIISTVRGSTRPIDKGNIMFS